MKITGNEIIVANSAAVTGMFSATGDPIIAGIRAYLDMVNAGGGIFGKEIKMLHIDDGYNGDRAVEAFHELKSKGVFAYLSHFGAPAVDATLDEMRECGIPVVGFATGLGRLYCEHADTMQSGANCFPIQPIYVTEGMVLTARASRMIKGGKLGVIYTSDDTGMDLFAGIMLQCRRLGIPFTAKKVNTEDASLQKAVEDLKKESPESIIIAAPQVYFPGIAGELKNQGIKRPVFTTYLNAVNSVAGETDALVKGAFDIYALSWLNYTGERRERLFEAAEWMGDYAMNAYAHCGWISASFFCDALKRTEPENISWEAFKDAMEQAPLQIPFGGKVNYAGGARMGTGEMGLVQLDMREPAGWAEKDSLKTIEEILSK